MTQYTNVEHLLNTRIVANINDKQSNAGRQFPGCKTPSNPLPFSQTHPNGQFKPLALPPTTMPQKTNYTYPVFIRKCAKKWQNSPKDYARRQHQKRLSLTSTTSFRTHLTLQTARQTTYVLTILWQQHKAVRHQYWNRQRQNRNGTCRGNGNHSMEMAGNYRKYLRDFPVIQFQTQASLHARENRLSLHCAVSLPTLFQFL